MRSWLTYLLPYWSPAALSVAIYMSDESSAGLDSEFWHGFHLEAANEHMKHALAGLLRVTESLAPLPHVDAVLTVAAEYTRLFIGPSTPPAPLWESLYREGDGYLFEQPTFDMEQILREHGLALDEGTHQFEDHLGIELLYGGVVKRNQRKRYAVQRLPSILVAVLHVT